MPRVALRSGVKVSQRAGRRAGGAFLSAIAVRRAAPPPRQASVTVPLEWSSFVSRCLRSWEAARASASDFLAAWTPQGLAEPKPATQARPDRARHRPSSRSRRRSRRAAQHPVGPIVASVWHGPVSAAGGAEALRARYPLVSALLVQLATSPPPDRRAPRAHLGG
jgi:hypothetical protein